MDDRIRVKFLTRDRPEIHVRQLPGHARTWGHCLFLFDREERDYDWLVVYDDVPEREGQARHEAKEVLACPQEHTLLVTTEPSSIKAYGSAYTAQFGHVITSQEPWALPHPHRIYTQPGLRWFYGEGSRRLLHYDALVAMQPPRKDRRISMVWSNKKDWYTNHRARYTFMKKVRDALPGLDVYGRGTPNVLDDKSAALDPYAYHIAIENHVAPHHWTEKLADAFLGFCLPFYHGCPNVEEYFPEESLVRIDIEDARGAIETIEAVMAAESHRKRLDAIVEARRRVLEEYNLFALLSREIEKRHDTTNAERGGVLYSRHALRRRSLRLQLMQAYEKSRNRLLYNLHRRLRPLQPGTTA
ncbi:MAG: hypothetical protein D6721_05625 [Gammaproteobacteria bacterium]|nr:MAG: hypothetical protein D6721_05625 [Gammaproteobacteria bacterium]